MSKFAALKPTPVGSRLWELIAAGLISSFFTLALFIAFNQIIAPTPSEHCSCSVATSSETPEKVIGESSSGIAPLKTSSEISAGRSGKSRFLIDPYPVLGPVRWEHLTPATQKDFTLDGKIQVGVWFVGATYNDTSQPEWSTKMIDDMVSWAKAGKPPPNERLSTYGPETDVMFVEALRDFPVKGQSVLVVGSRAPWVEAFCISGEAGSVTTVDFNVPIVNDSRVKALSIAELDATDERYDAVFTYSSLEHDGLGRYGDPINPWGDLERMKKLQGLTKPTGRLYLGVPNGRDSVHFNAHRIYGRVRFPMLIEGWTLLKTYGGYSLEQHYNMAPFGFRQPLHVLKLTNPQ